MRVIHTSLSDFSSLLLFSFSLFLLVRQVLRSTKALLLFLCLCTVNCVHDPGVWQPNRMHGPREMQQHDVICVKFGLLIAHCKSGGEVGNFACIDPLCSTMTSDKQQSKQTNKQQNKKRNSRGKGRAARAKCGQPGPRAASVSSGVDGLLLEIGNLQPLASQTGNIDKLRGLGAATPGNRHIDSAVY